MPIEVSGGAEAADGAPALMATGPAPSGPGEAQHPENHAQLMRAGRLNAACRIGASNATGRGKAERSANARRRETMSLSIAAAASIAPACAGSDAVARDGDGKMALARSGSAYQGDVTLFGMKAPPASARTSTSLIGVSL